MGQTTAVFADYEWHDIACRIPLSSRQLEISRCLFKGYSDKQIAMELGISTSTVRTHLSRLFAKAGIQDRVGYILFLTHHFIRECRQRGCPRRQ
ncbi:MAG TPA: LuxR family transcriptional regulator [Phycisphaerae bacterium]|nr:LuxR family transcriptional regulator [Phycisphaerae bacterium]